MPIFPPLELVTCFMSQLVNDLLSYFHQKTAIKHHMTIPNSKEENGIVGRANKEVNHHTQKSLFDKGHFKIWSRFLYTTIYNLEINVE